VKDKRIISVKNPKLRKIRDSLRELLFQASSAEWNRIYNEMKEIDANEEGDSIPMDELAPSQLKRFRELQDLKNKNREVARRSICMCYNCGKPNQDMYYNRPYRTWFCVGCVDFLKTAHIKMEVKKARGEYTCDPDDEFGQSFF